MFLDKLVTTRTTLSVVILGISWTALVASIASVARVRFLNLKSGQLALQDDYDGAAAIDIRSGRYSASAQWCLIVGMAALVFVGLANVNGLNQKESTVNNSNKTGPQPLERTIPYGSLKPNTAPVQTPAQTPTQIPATSPQPVSQPKE